VVLADGSVFVSSGGFNPTLRIMALALCPPGTSGADAPAIGSVR